MIGNKIHSIALSGEPTPASPIENIKRVLRLLIT